MAHTPSGSLPRETIFSIFRRPTSAANAKKKQGWAFSSGFILCGIGALNLLAHNGPAWGFIPLLVGVVLVGQGLLLLGYSEEE